MFICVDNDSIQLLYDCMCIVAKMIIEMHGGRMGVISPLIVPIQPMSKDAANLDSLLIEESYQGMTKATSARRAEEGDARNIELRKTPPASKTTGDVVVDDKKGTCFFIELPVYRMDGSGLSPRGEVSDGLGVASKYKGKILPGDHSGVSSGVVEEPSLQSSLGSYGPYVRSEDGNSNTPQYPLVSEGRSTLPPHDYGVGGGGIGIAGTRSSDPSSDPCSDMGHSLTTDHIHDLSHTPPNNTLYNNRVLGSAIARPDAPSPNGQQSPLRGVAVLNGSSNAGVPIPRNYSSGSVSSQGYKTSDPIPIPWSK